VSAAAWPSVALERLGGPLALVTVLEADGSAPREAGARMLVWPGGQSGTIGGGNLEHQATQQARRLLTLPDPPNWTVQTYPLGPLLGQCCGGRVRISLRPLTCADRSWLARAATLAEAGWDIEVDGPDASPAEVDVRPGARHARLLLIGAGHVGQAIARAVAPLPFRLEWYDSRPAFAGSGGATLADPAVLTSLAEAGAPFTLVLTHDHALDYALVRAALLGGGDGYVGLIGSITKRIRFLRRLRADGVEEDALGRLTCPIGLPALTGKSPEIIAASVAADLLIRLQSPGRPRESL
jgi:xanthine dehydrogenase accessory factor